MKIFDTHCHLNLKPLKDDFTKIITTCYEQNCYVNIVGIDLSSSLLAVKQAKNSKLLFCTIGIHPTEACHIKDENEIINTFENLLKNKIENKIIAIGETGFDFYHFNDNEYNNQKIIQTKWFQIHLQLAEKYNLPLMLHIRDGHNEMLEQLEKINHYGILHCYNQNYTIAQKYLALKGNWVFSIPGVVTYKKADDLIEAIKQIPIKKIIVETDAPWLAPVPFRGKTNYPYHVKKTLEKIAEIKKIDLKDCAKKIFETSCEIFNLKIDY